MDYDIFAKYYDCLTDNVEYENIANFIASFLPKGAITVDLGCGTGRLCRILSKLGYSMIGVDRSEGMLEEAYMQNSESTDKILYLQQDICKLDLFGSIKGAVCVLDTLNHLPNIQAVEKAIKKVSLFMEKDGIFIFDVNTEYKHQKILENNSFVYEFDRNFCVWQNQLNRKNSAVDIYLDFFICEDHIGQTYTRSSESFTEIYIPVSELERILKKYRFHLISVSDSYTQKPVSEHTQRITFVAKKEVDQ